MGLAAGADSVNSGTSVPDHSFPISVVIPARNRPSEVRRAIRSAQMQQPAPPKEIIVVDDASSDDTAEAAAAQGARVIRLEQNRGSAGARNAGIAAAAEEWIAFLDSDDEWLPGHLAVLWPARDSHVVVAASAARRGDSPLDGRKHGTIEKAGEVVRSPGRILFPENPIPLSASMASRAALQQAKGFDEQLRYSEDFDLWLRMTETGTARLLPDVSVIYHLHGGQKSETREALRRGQDRIVQNCSTRPWWTTQLGTKRATVVAWDDLQHARRHGDRRRARELTVFLCAGPTRWVALIQLWQYRRCVRRASADQ